MVEPILARMIRDSIAQKRVVKWGYVRQFGGLYPAECDSVAAHSNAVAVLSVLLAVEHGSALLEASGHSFDLEQISLMAMFHDFGEGRSGDTGAASYGARGHCNLHFLEREGLARSLEGLAFSKRALEMFDDYRAYRTPEAILVHVADNLEGLEKALHAARGAREVIDDALRIFQENLHIYRNRREYDATLGATVDFLIPGVLIPGNQAICDAYGLEVNISSLAVEAFAEG